MTNGCTKYRKYIVIAISVGAVFILFGWHYLLASRFHLLLICTFHAFIISSQLDRVSQHNTNDVPQDAKGHNAMEVLMTKRVKKQTYILRLILFNPLQSNSSLFV